MTAESKHLGTLQRWKKGESIEARRLDNLVNDVNRNSEGLSGPKQRYLNTSSRLPPEGLTDLNFTEVERTESTVEITDSNGDTFNVIQIDQVKLQNSAGDVLTLNFNNPNV